MRIVVAVHWDLIRFAGVKTVHDPLLVSLLPCGAPVPDQTFGYWLLSLTFLLGARY